MAAAEQAFASSEDKGYGYFVLADDNLQDPDIYIVKGGDLRALAQLSELRPSDLRPALLIGKPAIDLPFAFVAAPATHADVVAALDRLVEKRADALVRLEASDIVLVPERRRRGRLSLDLTDPAAYEKMRVRRPADGMVVVLDKSPALRDYLRDLTVRQQLRVEWAGDEDGAIDLCRSAPTAVLLINTSTPEVNPYRVSLAVKDREAPFSTAVVFLVSRPFVYDAEQARRVGVEGFLNKPLASQHLISLLKKYVPKLY
ncbi:MAG TPA: response regulator [Noviherbaspirillum sp.]|nr:response regulator [Noviherbaspirillum sp.]